MTIDGRRPAPDKDPEINRPKIRGPRHGERARAAMRTRSDEAALAAAVRELRTRRRQDIRA